VFGAVVEYTSVAPPDTPLRRKWQGSPEYVAHYVAQHTGVSLSLTRSRNRTREISQARRIAMLARQQLGGPLVQMSNFLAISQSSGNELLCLQSVYAQQARVTAIDVADKDSRKNNLAEFASRFGSDLAASIEQNRRTRAAIILKTP
jgi:hypothetical protein